MTDAPEQDLRFATELAERAGELLVDRIGGEQHLRYKSRKDVVTDADTASERLILDGIAAAYPDDGVLSEESGAILGNADSRRIWVVDPLDGTVNYANGLPVFCVSIALTVDGSPSVGVVRDPVLRETFAGGRGLPSSVDGRVLRLPDTKPLSDCVVSISAGGRGPRGRRRFPDRAVRANLDIGSAALELAWVAAGRLDAFVHAQGLSVWDVAAAGLIAEGAGAIVRPFPPGVDWFHLRPSRLEHGIVAAAPTIQVALAPLIGIAS